jgi:hypothetical protein
LSVLVDSRATTTATATYRPTSAPAATQSGLSGLPLVASSAVDQMGLSVAIATALHSVLSNANWQVKPKILGESSTPTVIEATAIDCQQFSSSTGKISHGTIADALCLLQNNNNSSNHNNNNNNNSSGTPDNNSTNGGNSIGDKKSNDYDDDDGDDVNDTLINGVAL